MNDPVPNIPLLRKCVEWAEVEAAKPVPEREWNQGAYVLPAEQRSSMYGQDCGTAYCIAGYAVQVTEGISPEDYAYGAAQIDARATELLGLTPDERQTLFDAGNDVDDVRRIAESVAARVGERL